jgi:hypothetical protein
VTVPLGSSQTLPTLHARGAYWRREHRITLTKARAAQVTVARAAVAGDWTDELGEVLDMLGLLIDTRDPT